MSYDISLRQGKQEITEEIVKKAFDEIFVSPPPHVISSFTGIRGKRIREVFVSMCLYDLKTSTEIAERLNTTPSSIRQALNQLETLHGVIRKVNSKNNRFVIVDNFLKEWVKREYN